MEYIALTTKEGKNTLAVFPDAPGCQTFAEPGEDIQTAAEEALEGWIEAYLIDQGVPPRPVAKAKGRPCIVVHVPIRLAVKLEIRWRRTEAGLTQGALAKLAGVSQQQIAKLEHPDANPTIDTLERVGAALGSQVNVALTPARMSVKAALHMIELATAKSDASVELLEAEGFAESMYKKGYVNFAVFKVPPAKIKDAIREGDTIAFV
ncbi:MAG: helix-turn-helix domain-containing protein [Archangiaceae bacterium]|nr:helix-turn-helix domain-containing protein [Archangiaceae bacterium]